MAEVDFQFRDDSESEELRTFFNSELKSFQAQSGGFEFEEESTPTDVKLQSLTKSDSEKNSLTDDENDDDHPCKIMESDDFDAKIDTGAENSVKCEKSCTTDEEIEDMFSTEQLDVNPYITENEELRRALEFNLDENNRLKSELREMKIFFNNREKEITASAESTIVLMENEFYEERNSFEEERREYAAQQSSFSSERKGFLNEIERIRVQLKREKSEEEIEVANKTLLNDLINSKSGAEMNKEELRKRLTIFESNATALENEISAMGLLKVAMENRIDQLEDEKEEESSKHEEQVTALLKAAGLYDGNYDETDDEGSRSILSNTWVDIFRKQLDEERMKINALKDCLVRLSSHLSSDDNDALRQAGIILVPHVLTHTSSTSSLLSISSSFRSFSMARGQSSRRLSCKL